MGHLGSESSAQGLRTGSPPGQIFSPGGEEEVTGLVCIGSRLEAAEVEIDRIVKLERLCTGKGVSSGRWKGL